MCTLCEPQLNKSRTRATRLKPEVPFEVHTGDSGWGSRPGHSWRQGTSAALRFLRIDSVDLAEWAARGARIRGTAPPLAGGPLPTPSKSAQIPHSTRAPGSESRLGPEVSDSPGRPRVHTGALMAPACSARGRSPDPRFAFKHSRPPTMRNDIGANKLKSCAN